MNHAAVVFNQQGDIFVSDLRHMNGLKTWAQKLLASQARQRTLTVLIQRLFHFMRCFMDMHMNADVHFRDECSNTFQCAVCD